MASYTYVAVDKGGKEKKGTLDGNNLEQVRNQLKAEGYMVLSVEEANILNKDINFKFGSGVKARDLSVFCRQFVGILNAGVSIINALMMLGEQTENKEMAKAIKDVQSAVEKGENLADAMRIRNDIFPDILINMVQAGEASGSLEIAFERMAVHFEKDAKMKAMVKKAMIYPVVVFVVAIAVVIFMMIAVIPKFVSMFEDMGVAMPFMTQLVIDMSNFIIHKWYILIIILAALITAVILFKNSENGKYFIAKAKLKLPLFGTLTVKSSSSRLARTLSTLMAAGLPLIEAMDITAKTMDNILVKDALMRAKEDVARGVALSIPLRECGLFPPMVYQMCKIGEETGNIEAMLEKVADYYDEEVEIATQALTAAMEPMIIVLLALIVGTIVIAIMQPMMSMYTGMDNL